jgi:hypothetical protein
VIEPRTVATSPLAVRRPNHSARSHLLDFGHILSLSQSSSLGRLLFTLELVSLVGFFTTDPLYSPKR